MYQATCHANWVSTSYIGVLAYKTFTITMSSLTYVTQPLFALWQCQFQAWIKEEGNANDSCSHTVLLNCRYS